MFLSALWTLILTAPIHCRGSIDPSEIMLNFSKCFDEKTNKLIYILDGLREFSKFSVFNFYFCVNYNFIL